MTTSLVRVARKRHVCLSGHLINPGDRYWEHTAFPGADSDLGVFDRPCRFRECAACGARYSRPVEAAS